MLLRFGVKNHRSIATYQELSLVATTLKDDESALLEPIQREFSEDSNSKTLKVLPVIAIYGANAAGKTTVLKALDFMSAFVVESHSGTASSDKTPFSPFLLDENSHNKPSDYDVDIAIDGMRFHYGFSLNGRVILREWLYSYDLRADRQVRNTLFVREESSDENQTKFKFGKSLRGENQAISKLVRNNSLFLSAAAQNAHVQLTVIFDFFSKKLVRRFDSSLSAHFIADQLSTYFGEDEKRKNMALQFLKSADIGVFSLDISMVPVGEKTRKLLEDFEKIFHSHFPEHKGSLLADNNKQVEANLLHYGVNKKPYAIKLENESSGTLSLLQLLGPIFARLVSGGVMVVDELNSTLHPIISREIIRLFSSKETNPKGAQLLFTTHDANLLSGNLLRRDQIWFAEKSLEGATIIYSLSDIKIRAKDDFVRGYLTGRFGAIPLIGCSENELGIDTVASNYGLTK